MVSWRSLMVADSSVSPSQLRPRASDRSSRIAVRGRLLPAIMPTRYVWVNRLAWRDRSSPRRCPIPSSGEDRLPVHRDNRRCRRRSECNSRMLRGCFNASIGLGQVSELLVVETGLCDYLAVLQNTDLRVTFMGFGSQVIHGWLWCAHGHGESHPIRVWWPCSIRGRAPFPGWCFPSTTADQSQTFDDANLASALANRSLSVLRGL